MGCDVEWSGGGRGRVKWRIPSNRVDTTPSPLKTHNVYITNTSRDSGVGVFAGAECDAIDDGKR